MQVGSTVMLGCTSVEEAAASGKLLVSVNSQGQVCGVRKTGRTAMVIGMVQHMIAAAQKQGLEVMRSLKAHAKQAGMS